MSRPSTGSQGAPNRLASQSSPYLLQHAFNPVDWFPWGEEAFAEARRRDVPILLSVGYSTCYWCHVMERECFEDAAIGKLMSERLVCIKLDREERPDVDEVYMTSLQMLTGHGGWPMNMFLEPEKLRPFWGGTYFPAQARMNLPGWPQVVERMSEVWRTQRAAALEQAESIADAVTQHLGHAPAPVAVGEAQVTDALGRLLRMFDRALGGFGTAPKFPQPSFIEFLLDVRSLAADDSTLDALDEAVRRTLNKMMCGGVFDQVGGGFHRYSVDATWTVPHFEKMLYDNAQLAHAYARAAGVYGDVQFARAARRTCAYMLREMRDPSGLFYSAQDAEVDGREGLNYLWTSGQVRAALGAEDAELAVKAYGLEGGPNFQDPHHPDEPPSNILCLPDRIDRLAARFNMDGPALESRLDRINGVLLAARTTRKQPHLDDKVLASWNGLAIAGLARAGRELDEPGLVDAARTAARAAMKLLVRGDGTLMRSFRAGVAGPPGVLEDYSFLVHGLLELCRAERAVGGKDEAEFLGYAEKLTETARRDFADGSGRWFDTRADQPDLFVRTSAASDGALPGAVSVMLHNLLDLLELSGRAEYGPRAAATLASVSGAIAASPVGAVNATRALLRALADDGLRGAAPSAGAPSAAPPAPEGEPFLPVEVYSDAERLRVPRGEPALLRLVLKIAPGYHVIAAEPGAAGEDSAPGLEPMRVGVHGGEGVRVFAEYPEGTAYGPEGAARIMVHEGTVEFRVAVEREGEWSGRPMLTLTYQACTERECLAPRTVELDVALDPG